MHDRDYTISVLQELQEMDIQIAMDDFGIGYSSLATSNASPHTLKVDREFVNDITTNPKDAVLSSP